MMAPSLCMLLGGKTWVLVLGRGPVFIAWEWGPVFVNSSVDGLKLCIKIQILRFDPQ